MSRDSMHSINVTPLTDVLLVLLITFLLTATSFQELSNGTSLPREADASEVAEQMALVSMGPDGRLQWPLLGLEQQSPAQGFRKLRDSTDFQVLGLAVHRDIPYEKFYPLMLSARQAGWQHIVLLTEADP